MLGSVPTGSPKSIVPISLFFFNVYLFLTERERQRMSRGGEERERGRHRIAAGSRL